MIELTELVAGVRAGDRTMLGRAITLLESTRPSDRVAAGELLAACLPQSGQAHRVGITGPPGVGKSTFIDALGTQLTAAGQRVAVLAVDPSSSVTGGSILGDKTRMERLSVDPNAFIRPSPSSGNLGGVGRATRETMIVLEAAGYDVVLVETVGVGQSETVVAEMVDFFLVLALPGAGDELQGIKKGIIEIADLIAINKSDASPGKANHSVRDYTAALRLLSPQSEHWNPPVLSCSALTGDGLPELWQQVELHRRKLQDAGALEPKRAGQQVRWMWSMIDARLQDRLRTTPSVMEQVDSAEAAVRAGTVPASVAADQLLDAFAESLRRES